MLFDAKDWLSALTPFARVPLELMTNRQMYFDSPIKETPYSYSYGPTWMTKLPQAIKGFLNIQTAETGEAMIDPYLKYAMDQLPQSRLINNMLFTTPNQKKMKSPELAALHSFAGFKLLPYRYEIEKQNYEYKLKDYYNSYLRSIEKMGYNVSSGVDLVKKGGPSWEKMK
jgi:hypothetical protein